MSEAKQTQGMRIFTLIWLGQVVSLIGSGLTGFALGVWVYKQTGSATQFTWISLSTLLPGLLISPLAGVLVDRWNRRWIIIVCDLLAALTTFVVFWTIQSDHLTIWLMCLAAAIYSILDAFQRPAYSVLTTLLVPEKRLAQASGMTQAAQALSQLIAPILAGLLLVYFQLQTVVLIDFFTFVFALATVLSVRFDGASAKPAASKQSLWQEMRFGWDYLKDQPALRDLMVFFASGNFLMSAAGILLTPLVLSFSNADALGTILSIGGVGMLVGSIVLGGFSIEKGYLYIVLGAATVSGLCVIALGLFPMVIPTAIAAFFFVASLAVVNGSSRVLFQKKVDISVQGRVFAFANMIFKIATPLAYLIAGPLADRVFEPLLQPGGALAGSIGQLLGVGPGRGIGLFFVVMGCAMLLATFVAYQSPHLRQVEEDSTSVDFEKTPVEFAEAALVQVGENK